ncbi:MAG TPA: biopolymer transporter ExbD [Gammaproteobacteria bacterium]|nr:biopolymer transporter ExbD [Gammaproteobacteria bacterium]
MNFRTRPRDDLDINITPLIDVVFILLIFFMVSTTFQKSAELQVQLPESTATPADDVPVSIEVVINAQGQFFLNGRELVNNQLATVRAAMQSIAEGKTELPVIVRADARTPHQAVVTAMDAASQLGLTRLSIATSHVEE